MSGKRGVHDVEDQQIKINHGRTRVLPRYTSRIKLNVPGIKAQVCKDRELSPTKDLRKKHRFHVEELERALTALEAEMLLTPAEQEIELTRERELAKRMHEMDNAIQANAKWRAEFRNRMQSLRNRWQKLSHHQKAKMTAQYTKNHPVDAKQPS